MQDKETYRNQDLVLQVDANIDPTILDLNTYETFLDTLCVGREYQKDAIREAVKFLLGGKYKNARDLAEENWHRNEVLQEKYSQDKDFYKTFPIADKLNCSIDLATGTGKSYVMYGIAQILLAEGAVDRVLVLCPSLTIEDGLTEKFEDLASNKVLKDLLPKGAKYRNPSIVNATGTVKKGDICIENVHAVFLKTKSAIRDSFKGNGSRTLVLNDEAHHIYASADKDLKKWEQFLNDTAFGFKYLVGLSGTCYTGDEYFPNVVYRYSMKEAIEEKQIKDVQYIYENPEEKLEKFSEEVKFQEIAQIHNDNKRKYNKIKPLTILITKDIKACNDLIGKFQKFLINHEKLSAEQAEAKTLIVTSHKDHDKNRAILKKVDEKSNKVEYIFSVSMLTEGWDVKNVFQIVPHEKKAFDSKLLISQVLGRGLRIPREYALEQPAVKVFNHDKWYSQIKGLVDEVLERDKRIYSYIVKKDRDYNFSVHNIDYEKEESIEEYKKEGNYKFDKEFITYTDQPKVRNGEIVFVSVKEPGSQKIVNVKTTAKMYSVEEVVNEVKNKISLWSESDEVDYLKKYPEELIERIVRKSLEKIREKRDLVNDVNMQKTLAAFGVIRRAGSKVKTIRYKAKGNNLHEKNIGEIERSSISLSALNKEGTIFYDQNTLELSEENEKKRIEEVEQAFVDGAKGLNTACKWMIPNSYNLKTPLNVVLVSHKPEREFVRNLVKGENAQAVDAWIKSKDTGFYSIDYAWRKGEHPKNGSFNPDFFIKTGKDILIVETKADKDICEENKGKMVYAKRHVLELNKLQNKAAYHFWMISPSDYESFFRKLREKKWSDFVSSLELELESN